MSSRVPPVVGHEGNPAMRQVRDAMSDGNGHEDCDDLAHWVAHLNASQRQAYAAYFQDRIEVLGLILEVVVNAKRERLSPIFTWKAKGHMAEHKSEGIRGGSRTTNGVRTKGGE